MSVQTRRWGLILSGHQFDIEDWVDAFPADFDPSARKHEESLLLFASDLDEASDSQRAHDIGKVLLSRLNGLMKVLSTAEPLALKGVAEIGPDGNLKRHIHIAMATGRFRSRFHAVGVVLNSKGEVVSPEAKPTVAQSWTSIALQNDLISDALTYVADYESWFSLYKAFECIRKHMGGEHKLLASGWTSKSEKDRFTRTADSLYRHHRGGKPPPEVPMTVEEGVPYVGNLIRLCIESAGERKQA